MGSFAPYKERTIKFIEIVSSDGWRTKIYGIAQKSSPLPSEIVSAGAKMVLPHLPQPAITEHRYGVGFLIIHRGTMRNWFLLDWWGYEDILHQKLFSSPLDDPESITPEADKSLIACVHELRIVAFESDAWIKTVLSADKTQSLDDYLKLQFDRSD